MSLPFLSRQDIETWVPDAAPSKVGVGFVAKLFTSINRAMASLVRVLAGLEDEAHRVCQNDLERFFLWGQGLEIVDGSLDEVLSHSKELHFRMLSLLLRLGTVVLQGMSHGPIKSSQLQLEHCDDLRTLLDTTKNMLQESESDNHPRPDTPSGSDASQHELEEIMEEISVYVDCLLDLAPALDNPALDIQIEAPDEPPSLSKDSFTTSCEEALIYCRKIRDRFDALPKYLVERLAEANVVRAAELRQMQSQDIKHESLFSGRDPRATETTKSTVSPPSVFSSALGSGSLWSTASVSKQLTLAGFDDNASEATFASFSTAASSSVMGRPRIPPMPEVPGDGFDCTVCCSRLTDVKTRKQWKRHVFGDLKPYLCTIEDCKDAKTLYSHSGLWAKHEAAHQSAASRPPECTFCSATYQEIGPAYYKHMSSHLREVSLSVLPRTADDDDEFDIDDTNSNSPVSSVEQLKIDSKMRIAIAGGNGLGYLLARELFEAANAYNVVVLSRYDRPEYASLDIQVMQVNYDDHTSLSYALHGVNLVISIVSGNEQLNLINAAAHSGVQLFVPSEFEGCLEKRPSGIDSLDPGLWSSQARTLLRRLARSSQMKWTVFSCGIFMERFLPAGLGSIGIGYGSGLYNTGSYLVDINAFTAEYVDKNARGDTVRICMTSVYDVARFVVAAIYLGPANWPREFTMCGDRLSLREVIGHCSRALNTTFQLSQWRVADLPQLITMCYEQEDYDRVAFYQRLLATTEGRYDFGQATLNDMVNSSLYVDVQPRSFRQCLAQILAETNRESDQRLIQSQKGELDCIVADGKSSSELEEDPAPRAPISPRQAAYKKVI